MEINLKESLCEIFKQSKTVAINNASESEIKIALFDTFVYRLQQKNVTEIYNLGLMNENCKAIAKFLTTPQNSGIILFGSPGCGKTIMLEIICQIINVCNNKVLKITHANILFNYLTAKTDEEKRRLLSFEPETRKMMFIDDLGVEPQKMFADHPLTGYLDLKYRQDDILFITTNLNGAAINKYYGERIESRIKEAYLLLNFGDTDFRVNK